MTPAPASRSTTSAAGSSGTKLTSVAWPGSVTTSARLGHELATALGDARAARTLLPRRSANASDSSSPAASRAASSSTRTAGASGCGSVRPAAPQEKYDG